MALRISDLTVATSFVGTDEFELSLAGAAGSRKSTGSNLRKQLFAGGTGFTSTDPLNAGITTLAGGTQTVSTPVLDVSQTWNAAGVTFTGIKMNVTNTASAAGSMLVDFQVGGTTQWNVTRSGVVTQTGGLTIVGAFAGATTGAFSGLITSTATTGAIASATATATPGAYAATQMILFASTVSGATLMGFGTTGDVTLKNRAGNDVLYIGPNSTATTLLGALNLPNGQTLQGAGTNILSADGGSNSSGFIRFRNLSATTKGYIGWGTVAVGTMSLDDDGGLACFAWTSTRKIGFYATAPIAQQTGVAVTAAAIHAACVALGLFTA